MRTPTPSNSRGPGGTAYSRRRRAASRVLLDSFLLEDLLPCSFENACHLLLSQAVRLERVVDRGQDLGKAMGSLKFLLDSFYHIFADILAGGRRTFAELGLHLGRKWNREHGHSSRATIKVQETSGQCTSPRSLVAVARGASGGGFERW